MRGERDRRLIEQIADLLSADYPLDLLIERLCDALAAAFDASAVSVALLSDDGRLRTSGGAEIAPESPAYQALSAGHPIVTPRERGIYVPVAQGGDSYGVVIVEHPKSASYRRDVRDLETICRYLAFAIRNQRVSAPSTVARRVTTLPYAAILIFTVLLSAAVLAYTSVRAQTAVNVAVDAQKTRAAGTAHQISDYIDDATQLAAVTARLLGPVRNDRARVETALRDLLAAAQQQSVYGIGVWYEPYVFDGHTRYYGPYVHRPKGDFRGAPMLTYEWMTAAYDFPSHIWYLRGRSAPPDTTVFTPPYFDTDYTYVSAVRPFRNADGRFSGVVTVDTVMPLLENIVRRNSDAQHGLVYVTRADGQPFLFPGRRKLLEFAAARGVRADAVLAVPPAVVNAYLATLMGPGRSEVSVKLAKTGWIVRDAQARGAVEADARGMRIEAIFAIAGIWLLAGLLAYATSRANRALERSRHLEVRQAELKSEIAQRIKVEERLRESAYRDALTGLPNRAAMLEQIDAAIGRMRARTGQSFAVAFIDLDRFNVVNDSLGHDAGDTLLALIARRLEAATQQGEFVARLGGDEFIFLLKNATHLSAALDAVRRIQKALSEPFVVSGKSSS